MERLTEETIGCFKYTLKDHKVKVGDFGEYNAFFDYSMAVKRLGEYEDSGLTPEQAQELAKAKAEGRLWILPVKLGDIIYRPEALQYCWMVIRVEIYEDEILFIDDSDNIFSLDDIGKTVFMSREAAEKAIGGGEDGK